MTHPLSQDELDLIRKQLEATTPGEWSWNDVKDMVTNAYECAASDDYTDNRIIVTDYGFYPPKENDRVFIASSKSHVSRLLDEVERLRAENAVLMTPGTTSAEMDYKDMRKFQLKFIEADSDNRCLRSMLGRAGEVIEPFAERYDELQERIRVATEERPEITANEVMALENHKAQYAYAKQVLSEIRGVSGE